MDQPQNTGDYLLTKSENNLLLLLQNNLGEICSRDQIAKGLWGNLWIDKYSDWEIDAQIYHLRHKLGKSWMIKTVRNRGYALISKNKQPLINNQIISPVKSPDFILPPISYIDYMNNPQKARKTLADLFGSLPAEFSCVPPSTVLTTFTKDSRFSEKPSLY